MLLEDLMEQAEMISVSVSEDDDRMLSEMALEGFAKGGRGFVGVILEADANAEAGDTNWNYRMGYIELGSARAMESYAPANWEFSEACDYAARYNSNSEFVVLIALLFENESTAVAHHKRIGPRHFH